MAYTIHIVHAAADEAAAHALRERLVAGGRTVIAGPAYDGVDERARCAVVLWSKSAASEGEPVFTAMIAALSADSLVLAALDKTALPFGFRDFNPVSLIGFSAASGAGAARALERRVDAMLARPRFVLSDAAARTVSAARNASRAVLAVSVLATAGLGAKAVEELGAPFGGSGGRLDEYSRAFDQALDRLDAALGAQGEDAAQAAACNASIADARQACDAARAEADASRARLARMQPGAASAGQDAALQTARDARASAETAVARSCELVTVEQVDELACNEARQQSGEANLRGLSNAPIFRAGPAFATCADAFGGLGRDWGAVVGDGPVASLDDRQIEAAYMAQFGIDPRNDQISGVERCSALARLILRAEAAAQQACAPQAMTRPSEPDACERARTTLAAAEAAEDAAEAERAAAGATVSADDLAAAEAAVARTESAVATVCDGERLSGETVEACKARGVDTGTRARAAFSAAERAAAALCRFSDGAANETEARPAQASCDAAREALEQRRGRVEEASLPLRRADVAGLAAVFETDVWGWLPDVLPEPVKRYAIYIALGLAVLAGWFLNRVLSVLLRLFGARTRAPARRLINKPGSDVFISYSRKNASRVKAIADLIERLGLSIWIDRTGIAAGEAWTSKIVEAIRRSEGLTLMGSKAAFGSDNVYRELHVAAYVKKPIKPFVLDGAEPPDAFLYFMAGANFVDLSGVSAGALKDVFRRAYDVS